MFKRLMNLRPSELLVVVLALSGIMLILIPYEQIATLNFSIDKLLAKILIGLSLVVSTINLVRKRWSGHAQPYNAVQVRWLLLGMVLILLMGIVGYVYISQTGQGP